MCQRSQKHPWPVHEPDTLSNPLAHSFTVCLLQITCVNYSSRLTCLLRVRKIIDAALLLPTRHNFMCSSNTQRTGSYLGFCSYRSIKTQFIYQSFGARLHKICSVSGLQEERLQSACLIHISSNNNTSPRTGTTRSVFLI